MAEAATYDLIVVGMFFSTETFPLDRLSCSAMERKLNWLEPGRLNSK
jgi:hypothetical protein